MTFDYAAQKAETERLWAEIFATGKAPSEGMVDLHFVPAENADSTEFIGWLEDNGYDVEHFESGSFEEGDEDEVIEVQTDVMPLSAASIHDQERKTTEAALRFGFRLTGWGVMGV
ncbi:MAG: ribonuclease E inhibitor RraB [Jannaschia sp.]